MESPSRHSILTFIAASWLLCGLFVLVVFWVLSPVTAMANPEDMIGAAEFVRYVKMPGQGDGIVRPSALHYDRFHDEILVGDSGNNRVLVFSSNGIYRFGFYLTELMSIPQDITVDPEGFIYVLGSDVTGQIIYRFDFDGVPMVKFPIVRQFEGKTVDLRNLACDDFGSLYTLDHSGRRIFAVDSAGELTLSVSIEDPSIPAVVLPDGEVDRQGAYALGALSASGTKLFVPVANAGTVYTFSTSGEYLGSIGHYGAKPGTLNFPVAVEASPEGFLMVIDKARYCVVCFDQDGEFLGEFGGKGVSPGWFMGPTLLAIPSADRVIVGQVYANRIQICVVPDRIRDQVRQSNLETTPGSAGLAANATGVSQEQVIPHRRYPRSESSHVLVSLNPQDGEFSPSSNNGADSAQPVPYPEVSE